MLKGAKRGSVLLILLTIESHAATYYVRNGGNDSADGRSHATAWASIDKVNSFSFSAGDNVLFHEGHTWRGQKLVVDWGGTSASHAVVGAYYRDGSTPRRGYRTARPVIDGEDRIPSRYDALIRVTAPRVRVENLAVMNSEGRGVDFNEAERAQVIGLYVENTYDCGIVLTRSHDSLIEGNHVVEADRQRPEDGLTWCAAIATVRTNRAIVRRNIVERSYGEGLNTNYGSTDTVIEENLVFAIRAAGIYADSAPRTTIRRNIVLGTTDRTYWRYDTAVGPGIALNTEPYSHVGFGGSLDLSVQSTDARIYNNLVAFTRRGIGFWGGIDNATFDNTLIYNNTLIDNDEQFGTINRPMPGSVFANNILVSFSSGTRDVSGTASGLRTRNNYYSQGDPGGIYSHSGNKYSGLALAKMSGWRSIRTRDDVSWPDFAPTAASATNGAGDSSHVAASSEQHSYHLDFNGREHASPIDMGAVRFGESLRTPKGPRLVEAQLQ